MGDKSLRGRGRILTPRGTGRTGSLGPDADKRRLGPDAGRSVKRSIGAKTSPVAKSRVIDRMKEEAKALGGSFFTAEEMEAKIKKMKKKAPYGGEKI